MLVIPAIDISNGECVRLMRGRMEEKTVYSREPAKIARQWEEQGAAVLHLVDLDGAFAGKPTNLGTIGAIVRAVGCVTQLGGGIRTFHDIEVAFSTGVDRVILGTKASGHLDFLQQALSAFAERIVVSIDAREGKLASRGWTETTSLDAYEAARRVQEAGCARIVFTDIGRDGTMDGPNLPSLERLLEAVQIPVIASGGVGRLEDVAAISGLGPRIEGAIVGRALYEKKFTLEEAIEITVASQQCPVKGSH